MVIAGGEGEDGNHLISTEMLNLNTMIWTVGPELPLAVSRGGSVPYGDTFLVVAGGSENGPTSLIFEFDIASNNWLTRKERLSRNMYDFDAFLIPDEFVECS